MRVIPSLNSENYTEARKLAARIKQFLPRGEWVHLDLGDGVFSTITTWGDPNKLKSLRLDDYRIEVHLMVEHPDDIVEDWLKAGVARVIVHVEAVKNMSCIHEMCILYSADLMLALSPETSVEHVLMYVRDIRSFMVLGVVPGRSGQTLCRDVLDKVAFLSDRYPGALIEVDGGVTVENIAVIKKSGAKSVAVYSALFSSNDLEEVYLKMSSL